MKTVSLIVFLLPFLFLHAQEQKVLLDENFQSYTDGSDGAPMWHPVKGIWEMKNYRYEQRSPEYDCASMLESYMQTSFTLEAVFEHLGGEIGVGFIFSSRNYDDISFSQMVRYDGGTTFLMGYFQNGEFNATASVKAGTITAGTRHTLSLNVRRDTHSFSVFLDGKKITAEDIPLTYAGGYVGLQSSAGSVRFHKVTLTRIPTKNDIPSLDWIGKFKVLSDGTMLIPDERQGIVRRISPSGVNVQTIGKPSKEKGQLVHPNSCDLIGEDTVVITDRGTNRLHLFSMSGKWLKSTGWQGSSTGQFNQPAAVAVNSVRQIFVADRENNRIQVFDDALSPVSEFGKLLLKKPSDIAIDDSTIYVLNAGLCQIEIYSWNGRKAEWKSSLPFGGGEGKGLAVMNNNIYLTVVNQVKSFDVSGKLLTTFTGKSIDFIFPQGITVHHDTLFVADYFGGRIIKTSLDLMARSPEIISMDSHISDGMKTFNYRMLPNIIGTIPPARQDSRQHSFTTTTKPKTTLYTRIKMATLLFTHILDDSAGMARYGEPPPVAAGEIERIRRQINDGIRFYWIHSGMNFFIDMDFIIVNDKLWRNEIYGSEWWYPPKEEVLDNYLRLNGKDKDAYGGFLYLSCTQSFDSTRQRYTLSGKGGGFTMGVGTGKGYGISWWDVTKKHHNAGNNWLMVHEFNHQLDDIFMVSGYPEYWFNHISPTIGTAADFGEHFDANAHILRMVPAAEWTDLRYTTLAAGGDRDGDGIPDKDVSLPLDEVRLQSDSTSKDSDNDGVPDIEELGFSNWLVEGWGETFGGEPIFPGLHITDTDNDGIRDADDPYPCSPMQPNIYFHNEGVESKQQPLVSLHDERIKATVFAKWNHEMLSFSVDMDTMASIKFMLDAEADGWFLGRGNYLIHLTPSNDTGYSASLQIFNATNSNAWPFMDKSISDTTRIFTKMRKTGNMTSVQMTIPGNDFLGLNLVEHEQVGISIGWLCPVDETGAQRYLTPFEPNRFFDVRLVK